MVLVAVVPKELGEEQLGREQAQAQAQHESVR